MYRLTSEQLVPASLEDVFAYFGQPENLGHITPSWLGFRILTPSPVAMRVGALIDYEIRLGPLPTRWRTMITAFDPPHLFVDEQLAGPYSFWHHTHRFASAGTGTRITDEILYLMPFGPLGQLVHHLFVRRQLTEIFAHRKQVIAERFPGSLLKAVP